MKKALILGVGFVLVALVFGGWHMGFTAASLGAAIPLPDGCPGYTESEVRISRYGAPTSLRWYARDARIPFAEIPVRPKELAAALTAAGADHTKIRGLSGLRIEAPWDVRVLNWGTMAPGAESLYAARDAAGTWQIERVRVQYDFRGGERVMSSAVTDRGRLASSDATRLEALLGGRCLYREPPYFDEHEGNRCMDGEDYLIETRFRGRAHTAYQGCRLHGHTGEVALLLNAPFFAP